MGDVDIEKVLLSNKIFLGEKNYKYFIGYLVTIWDKVSADKNNNFIENLPIIKIIWKPKWSLMAMKLQIFTMKKLDSNHTYLAVISLDSTLKKNDNCCLQVVLKECKYIEKKAVRHIHDNLNVFVFFWWWVWWRIN